jgi:hypothetical protein
MWTSPGPLRDPHAVDPSPWRALTAHAPHARPPVYAKPRE